MSESSGHSLTESANKEEKNIIETSSVDVGDLEAAITTWDNWTARSLSEEQVELIAAHLADRTTESWLEILNNSNLYHADDQLVPRDHRDFLAALVKGPLEGMSQADWELMVKFEAFLSYEWSIYPEVRNVTVPIDEENDEEYETFRVYVIGLVWAMAGCALDTFFEPRFPTITITTGALQLLISSHGRLWAKLPYCAITYWKGKKLVINTGKPWSFREQMLASVTMSVSVGTSYAQDMAIALSNGNFYGEKGASSFGFIILMQLACSFAGFGLAGIMRAFFVYPTKMVFFDTLNMNQLNRSLVGHERRENVNGWKLKGVEFFWLFAWVNFAWYWITNFVFQALSYFDWMAWIKPQDVDLQAITGVISGLGVNPVETFDPNVISFTSIYTPWSSLWQWHFGYLFSTFAIIIIWYTNVRWTGYLPINSNKLFSNTGVKYNVAEILNDDHKLDQEKYQNYSLPFLTAGNLVNYGSYYIYYTAITCYMILNYWKFVGENMRSFWDGLKSSTKLLNRYDDRFSRTVRKHPEAPEWWYAAILIAGVALAIAAVEYYSFTETPVWTLFLGIGISFVLLIPVNTLRARTAYFFNPSLLFSLIIGYAAPGNGYALLVSQTFASAFSSQTDNWVDNQKISHYAGLAPRALFRCQAISALTTCFVMAGIITWQTSGALGETFCTQENHSKFYCQPAQTAFNSAVVWGTIGPKRVFEGLYPQLKWCFLIGVGYPFIFWGGRKVLPRFANRYEKGTKMYKFFEAEWLFNFNEVVFLNAGFHWAPSNWYYHLPNFFVGIFWHKWLRPRYPRWWTKYTYLFYNSISVGCAFAALFCFFATSYNHVVGIDWWGNNVFGATADSTGEYSHVPIPVRGYFGPEKGHFPVKG